jgi:hypothetical protein
MAVGLSQLSAISVVHGLRSHQQINPSLWSPERCEDTALPGDPPGK